MSPIPQEARESEEAMALAESEVAVQEAAIQPCPRRMRLAHALLAALDREKALRVDLQSAEESIEAAAAREAHLRALPDHDVRIRS